MALRRRGGRGAKTFAETSVGDRRRQREALQRTSSGPPSTNMRQSLVVIGFLPDAVALAPSIHLFTLR